MSGVAPHGGSQRHRAREFALQILYRFEIEPVAAAPTAQDLSRELLKHFEHFQVPAELREFTGQLAAGVVLHRAELDPEIEKRTPGWKLSRMPIVDRQLLRLAAYELKYELATPHHVIIDEAVELAKTFGTVDTPAFVNGVLDALRTSLRASVSD